MRIAKHIYPLMALVLNLGLLYSQVCNVICVSSGCAGQVPVRKVAEAEHPTSGCHNDQTSREGEQPPDDPHKCPAHDPAVLFLQLGTISIAVLHQPLPPTAAVLVPGYDIAFDLAVSGTGQCRHFRSPPLRPQLTILRI